VRDKRLLLATCIAASAFVASYLLPNFVPIPLMFYKPSEHAWIFAVKVPGIGIDFYGRCLLATVIAMLVGGGAYVGTLRLRPPGSRVVAMMAVLALALALLAMAFFGWTLAHRTLSPSLPEDRHHRIDTGAGSSLGGGRVDERSE
jgi:hypothetical protein